MKFYSETLIRSILGPIRGDIRPLARAVEITATRLFTQHIVMDDIFMHKDIYYDAAKQLGRKSNAVARQAERFANLCRDKLIAEGWTEKYIGRQVSSVDSPRTMIVYLAVYAQFGKPFYVMLAEHPELFTGSFSPEQTEKTE